MISERELAAQEAGLVGDVRPRSRFQLRNRSHWFYPRVHFFPRLHVGFFFMVAFPFMPLGTRAQLPAGLILDESAAPGANYDKAEFRLWFRLTPVRFALPS